MSYAIIRTGGKQFRVSPGDVVRVPTLADKNEGDKIEFDEVLVSGDDGGVRIGAPTIAGTRHRDRAQERAQPEDHRLQVQTTQTLQAHKRTSPGFHRDKDRIDRLISLQER